MTIGLPCSEATDGREVPYGVIRITPGAPELAASCRPRTALTGDCEVQGRGRSDQHRLTIGIDRDTLVTMQIPQLGELETAVLEFVWSHGAVEVKDVHRTLGTARNITLNTIQSTLERLHRKRLLARERIGHAYRYAAVISRDEFRARAVAGLAGTLRGAEGAGVIAAFVDLAARADKRNLDRLEALIAEARTRRGGRS